MNHARHSVLVAPATSKLEEIEIRTPGPGDVGDGVDAPAIGDLVTGRWGSSFAELMVVLAEYAVVVPPGLSEAAGIGEPLGCIVEALCRARIDTGDRVAVVGAGFMGLCLIQLLATNPIGELVAIDVREDAKRAALLYGASAAFNPGDVAQLHPPLSAARHRPGVRRPAREAGWFCQSAHCDDSRRRWGGHVVCGRRLGESHESRLAELVDGC